MPALKGAAPSDSKYELGSDALEVCIHASSGRSTLTHSHLLTVAWQTVPISEVIALLNKRYVVR